MFQEATFHHRVDLEQVTVVPGEEEAVPANALQDRAAEYILDRAEEYIETR